MRLVVLKNTVARPDEFADAEVVSFDELKRWAKDGRLFAKLLRYQSAEMVTYALPVLGRLLPTALVMRVLARGRIEFADRSGAQERVTLGRLAELSIQAGRDYTGRGALVARTSAAVESIPQVPGCRLKDTGIPLYLRTDFAFGLTGGGSVGHIAGVLNNLDEFGEKPVFISSDRIPTTREDIETHVVWPSPGFRDFGELWSASANGHFANRVHELIGSRPVRFVYQRYSHNNYVGLAFAKEKGVPFVLEYNGSEVWMARHWGTPLKYEALAEKVELANLHGSDLIVVVSKAMRDELVARGIEDAKILVNPNGVDSERYAPEVDGSAVRGALDLGDRIVIGFIGTFGRWHGAEVLAEAYGRLLESRPELRETTRLLMVGDGVTMPEVRSVVERFAIGEQVVLTGLVPQEQGPAHLAAMDILASPHVPNPDGTPFFGSPTKLFEYMAMGRGIVASDLDQIGEVLDHDKTAWMVEPGDADALVSGLATLIDDPERRARLGSAARAEALAKYTWREHTRRIVEALKERCG